MGYMDRIVRHDDCGSNNRNLAVVYHSNRIMDWYVIHNKNDMGISKQRLKANWDVLVPFSFFAQNYILIIAYRIMYAEKFLKGGSTYED